jgi:hypothetical protein
MPSMAAGASGSSGLSGLFLPPENSPKKILWDHHIFFLQRVGAAVSIPTIPEMAGRPTRAWGKWGHLFGLICGSGFHSSFRLLL